jgi:hypothetical protein
VNRTEEALAGISRAVRRAGLDIERELQRHDMKDLPSPVVKSLHLLTTAIAGAIEQLESYRPSERRWIRLWAKRSSPP